MSQLQNDVKVYSASITDRGLNERRPLNEDSLLEDSEHCIFAVADGVGGSEAGEVASQTAIEVLEEAFRHQLDGADIEDLMELAIQRANASINRMAKEHTKLSMMATTIVVLHVKGHTATVGHVGDSRLYRLTPQGTLMRETEDHSIVEEEVRAGRMTAEQAAHHPSKNVISRALGAEETAEVDLKQIEIEEGTCFLLCSDGITRHIADNEIRAVLVRETDLAAACAELKRRCYQRGAEDNLTAVIVRLGEPADIPHSGYEDETIENPEAVEEQGEFQSSFAGNFDLTEDALVAALPAEPPPPATAIAPTAVAPTAVAPTAVAPTTELPANPPLNIPEKRSSGFGRFILFLFFIACVGGALYAGARFHNRLPPDIANSLKIPTAPSPSPVAEDPMASFEKAKRDVDRAPADWLKTEVPKEEARLRQTVKDAQAIASTNPEFLYLYGRALLLSGGDPATAAEAFDQSIARAGSNQAIKKEATLGLAAAGLRSTKDVTRATTRFNELVPPSPTATPQK